MKWIGLFFVVVSVIGWISVSDNALAQQDDKHLFKAYLSLSDAYDSNVLKAGEQSAEKGDNIIYVQPSLSVLLPFRFGADLNVDYTFTYLKYSKFSVYDTYYNDLNASLNFYPVKNLVFGILDSYTVVPISPQLPTFAATNITQENYLDPYITYDFYITPRFYLNVRYDYIKVDFPGSLGIAYTVSQPQISAAVLLNHYLKIKPGFKYISQTFTASSIGTINQSEPFIEIDIANGSRLSFTGSYGYLAFSFTNTSQSGSIYLANLTYKPDDRLNADIYVHGSKLFDIFGRLYTQFEVGLDARYNLTERVSTNAEIKYLKLKYAGENYYTDASGGDIGINYRFIRWSELFATYYYYDNKPETSNGSQYQDSRILVGIRAGLL